MKVQWEQGNRGERYRAPGLFAIVLLGVEIYLALGHDILHDEDEEKTNKDDELREWVVDRYVVLVLDLIQQMVHGLLDVGKEVHDACGEEHLRERQCL